MSLLTSALGGAVEAQQENYRRIDDNLEERARESFRARMEDKRIDASKDAAILSRENQLSDYDRNKVAAEEAAKTTAHKEESDYLRERRDKKEDDAAAHGYRMTEKGGDSASWDLKDVVLDNGIAVQVPYNKNTGEFKLDAPHLNKPTISLEEARDSVDTGSTLGFGGMSEAEISAEAERIMASSTIAAQLGGQVSVAPSTGQKVESSFNNKPEKPAAQPEKVAAPESKPAGGDPYADVRQFAQPEKQDKGIPQTGRNMATEAINNVGGLLEENKVIAAQGVIAKARSGQVLSDMEIRTLEDSLDTLSGEDRLIAEMLISDKKG